jgi:hypothetical protein
MQEGAMVGLMSYSGLVIYPDDVARCYGRLPGTCACCVRGSVWQMSEGHVPAPQAAQTIGGRQPCGMIVS